jgi:hypothetical protein
LFFGNQIKIRLLGEEASDQPDGIFNRSLFPTMEGFTEVGSSSQHLVSILMFHIFATIIVGDRADDELEERHKEAKIFTPGSLRFSSLFRFIFLRFAANF